MTKEIRLEDLVGKRVRDVAGTVVGTIRDVEAEWRGNRCVVTNIHLDGAILPITAVDLAHPSGPRLRENTR